MLGDDENRGQTQSAKEPLQILIGPIMKARAKKFQEALNGLMKEFIWANLTLQEEFGPSQAFGGIREPTKKSKRS